MTTTPRATVPERAARPAGAPSFVLVVAVAVLLIIAGAVVWHVRTSAQPTAPYADPAAAGRLTLCAPDGTPLTKGSLLDRPFAATVVAGTSAAGGYAAPTRTATLLAAQPRAGVDAAEWSTLDLTPARPYARPTTPTVRLDAAGTTLGQFLNAYPAVDDGWVQLRVVLGAAGLPTRTQSYAAVDLHVSGHTWTVADPGSARCPTNP